MTNKHQQARVTAATTTTTTQLQRRIEFQLPSKSSSSTLSHPLSSSSKNTDSSDFLDAGVDFDFGFRISYRKIGAGLENLGNTCFLNSVIQCLTYTEPLVAYLQSGKHQNTCRVVGFCALCAIQKHVNRALQSTGRIVAPKDLVSNLRRISRNFRNARQEDAHEYMIHLLESMHKCCIPLGVPAESPGAYEKSLVHKIFGGRLRSQVKCLQCSHCSNTFDPFLDLSLEITKADSLYKALTHFTAAEQLDGGERQYKCERCKQKVKALKQLTVYKAPYVLTVHLKRFRHFSGQKIDKKVQFGSSLNLKPFVSGAYEGDLTYTLYGVLVHAGWSTHSGHYYCYVRTSTGIWYSLDDNRVFQVSEKTVMEQKAYMLFYVRDRKNVGPKKPVNVHKENLITSMQNASSSSSISGVKILQKGFADKTLKEAISSSLPMKNSESHNTSDALGQQNTSKFGVSNNLSLNKELNQISNCRITSKAPASMKDNSSFTKTDMDGKEHPKTKFSGDNYSEKSLKATTFAAGCGNGEKTLASSEKHLIPDCPSSVANSDMVSTAAKNLQNSVSNDVKDGLAKTVVPSDPATRITVENENAKIKDGDLEPMSDADLVVSKPSCKRLMNGLSSVKSPESTSCQRLMKEIFKSSVGGTHLSFKMLYWALSLRNRKRFKRMKRRSKAVLQQHLVFKDIVPADMGPSTSDSNSALSYKHLHEKVYGSSIRGEKGACSKSSCSKEPNSLETSSLPPGTNCTGAEGLCSKKPNAQVENGVSSSVSRGLEESAVGCWEDTGSPLERRDCNSKDTFSIGHVLNDWDEEYDRGKRKKVRGSRNSFGGPNFFQEVAAKKAKLKS